MRKRRSVHLSSFLDTLEECHAVDLRTQEDTVRGRVDPGGREENCSLNEPIYIKNNYKYKNM